MKFQGLLISLAVLISGVTPQRVWGADSSVRRFALIIGANDGGPDRVKLHYAVSDAQVFSGVIEQLGGVATEDRLVILDPSVTVLRRAMDSMKDSLSRSRRQDQRLELVVYFSGHSDEQGLLLGAGRLDYDELRQWLASLAADVRIAILDSCASGALTRGKGGVRGPAFMADQATKVRGHAFLTSSSADEPSQESERLGASFFTHYLVSGLRGAADFTRDSRVTLNEAYQFAFQETLARTAKTQGGAQHPAYDISLIGTGDLVITDLHARGAATLVFPETIPGHYFVWDASGRLVAELRSHPGFPVELGLQPGALRVVQEEHGHVAEARVVVAAGQRVVLQPAQLLAQASEPTVSRGGGGSVESAEQPVPDYRVVPVDLSIIPPLSINGWAPRVSNHLSLSLLAGRSTKLHGVALSPGVHWTVEEVSGLQFGGLLAHSGGGVTGVQLSAGANIAAGELLGVQVAGVFNHVGGNAGLLQAAAGPNLVVGNLGGVQTSGVFNLVRGDASGLQATAGMNLTGGALRGLQIGVLNVSGDVNGAQIGLVNIARKVAGTQVGVLNIAQDVHGAPIGLLSIVREGQFHTEVWGSETSAVNVGVKAGSKSLYTLLAAGAQPQISPLRWTLGFGLGGHVDLGKLYVDLDLLAQAVYYGRIDATPTQLMSLRAVLGYEIAPAIAVFVGPTYNLALLRSPGHDDSLGFGQFRDLTLGTYPARQWAGLVAGLRFF